MKCTEVNLPMGPLYIQLKPEMPGRGTLTLWSIVAEVRQLRYCLFDKKGLVNIVHPTPVEFLSSRLLTGWARFRWASLHLSLMYLIVITISAADPGVMVAFL